MKEKANLLNTYSKNYKEYYLKGNKTKLYLHFYIQNFGSHFVFVLKNCDLKGFEILTESCEREAKFLIKYMKKIVEMVMILKQIMPTYLEFPYVYYQVDLYVLNGNIIKLLNVNFGLR